MKWIAASSGADGILFLILGVAWVIIQVLNRLTRRPPAREPPKQAPASRPGTRPTARDPADDLRRFLEELSGMEPSEPEEKPDRPSAPSASSPPPVPAHAPPPLPPTATAPAWASARRRTPKPDVRRAQVPLETKKAFPAFDEKPEPIAVLDLTQAWSESAEAMAPSQNTPLRLSLPSLPTTRMNTSGSLGAFNTWKEKNNVVRLGDRSSLRRAVILSTLLGAPRALAPIGHDRPYGEK